MAFYLIKYIENTEHNKKTTSIYGEDREAPEKKNKYYLESARRTVFFCRFLYRTEKRVGRQF
jgi:hypothetical protein